MYADFQIMGNFEFVTDLISKNIQRTNWNFFHIPNNVKQCLL